LQGDAIVGEQHPLNSLALGIGAGEQDIGWLDVPVQNAEAVALGQRIEYGQADPGSLGR
jgi:hypothetical protein